MAPSLPICRPSGIFLGDQWRRQGRSRRGDRYGLDAHPCQRYRDGGSRAAGAERISGRGKPHLEEPVEWAIEALRHRASHAWKDRSSPGPPSPAEVATVARPDSILVWYRKL